MNKLKVAIYYDWLNQWGGAEKVLLNILNIFPEAELFTLFHDPEKTKWLPNNVKIHTSFLQNFPRTSLLAPIYDIAAESLKFDNFDIVIGTTSNVGHCLLTPPQSLFVCYYHNLNRHIYLRPPKILSPLTRIYKAIDKIYSRRPDVALCNSKTTQRRLQKHLSLSSFIINPGINTKFFIPVNKPTNDYYLVVSRLVPHKNIDYVISAFKNINKKLIIIGTGRDKNRLIKLAGNSPNITFTGQVNNNQLLKYYQNCTSLICPQIEDFGLVALEAQSCGRPIITLNKGGITESVINQKTGIFFRHQNKRSLNNILKKFDQIKFNSVIIRQQAVNFDEDIFMINFKKQIDKLWQIKQI